MTALAASSGYRAPAASSIDRAIRLSTAAAVLGVAGIAAYVVGQRTGQPTISASAQHGDGVSEADANNFAAVAAYRLSVKADNPLSERKLAGMFGRTSRRWARARITEAWQSLQAPHPVMLRDGTQTYHRPLMSSVPAGPSTCRP